MYMIDCYKAVLTTNQFINSSYDEIMDLCNFDYSVETTPEIYFSTPIRKLRYLSNKVFGNGEPVIEAYYLLKHIEGEKTVNEN